MATLFHLGDQISASMLPQAATTAIALPVSDGIGGVKELTSLAVILNAVVISALGGKIVKCLKFQINCTWFSSWYKWTHTWCCRC